MRERDHLFDGALDGSGVCATCQTVYESGDGRHDFGKLINPESGTIRPYVAADAEREQAEIDALDAAIKESNVQWSDAVRAKASAAVAADPDALLTAVLRLADPVGGLDLIATLAQPLSDDPNQPNISAYLHGAAADLRAAIGLTSPARNAS